jgi:hypothetical protein
MGSLIIGLCICDATTKRLPVKNMLTGPWLSQSEPLEVPGNELSPPSASYAVLVVKNVSVMWFTVLKPPALLEVIHFNPLVYD